MELDDGLDALAEDVEGDVLVGRVDGIALEAEAHEDGLDAEYLLKVADDGYAATASHGEGLLAEGLCEALLGGLVGWEVDGTDIALAAMHGCDLDLHIVGGSGHDMVDEEL